MTVAMLLFGLLTVVAAAGVVFSRRTISSALCLVATFFLMSSHYAMLGADLIAALQVMVYAGAIMVLVVFVIMLLGLRESAGSEKLVLRHYVSVVFLGLFVAVLFFVSTNPVASPSRLLGSANLANKSLALQRSSKTGVPQSFVPTLQPAIVGSGKAPDLSPKGVGLALFQDYIFPYEVTSVLLLAAVLGAVLLAYEPKNPLPTGRGLKAKRRESEMGAAVEPKKAA